MHYQKHFQSITKSSTDPTKQQEKAALLAALRKPILTRHQLDEIMARLKRPITKPPNPPRCISLWRGCKETMAVMADGMAMLPILGVTSIFGGFDDLLYHLFTLQWYA